MRQFSLRIQQRRNRVSLIECAIGVNEPGESLTLLNWVLIRVTDVKPKPSRVPNILTTCSWVRRVEIDEGDRPPVAKHAVAGTRISVANDLLFASTLEADRDVVELTKELRSGAQLTVVEPPQVGRYITGNEGENLDPGFLAEETWTTREPSRFEMLEQAMHERGMRSRWPAYRVANALDTRSSAADETCHARTGCWRSNALAQRRAQ